MAYHPSPEAFWQVVLGAFITIGGVLFAVSFSFGIETVKATDGRDIVTFHAFFLYYLVTGLTLIGLGILGAGIIFKGWFRKKGTNQTEPDQETVEHEKLTLPVKLQLLAIAVSIAVLTVAGISLAKSGETLETAQKSLAVATRPPHLIMEYQSERDGNVFHDDSMTYTVGGAPVNRADEIRINVWNTGAQVAENITVSLLFNPVSAEIVDTQKMQKCRDVVCNFAPVHSNIMPIRAIEAGGFYTIVATYTVFPGVVAKLPQPLNMTIAVDYVSEGEAKRIAPTYKVDMN